MGWLKKKWKKAKAAVSQAAHYTADKVSDGYEAVQDSKVGQLATIALAPVTVGIVAPIAYATGNKDLAQDQVDALKASVAIGAGVGAAVASGNMAAAANAVSAGIESVANKPEEPPPAPAPAPVPEPVVAAPPPAAPPLTFGAWLLSLLG